MKVSGLIWATAKGERMTLAELMAFVAEAREAGVPEDASPHVGTSWRGGIRRIAVSRPLPKQPSESPGRAPERPPGNAPESPGQAPERSTGQAPKQAPGQAPG